MFFAFVEGLSDGPCAMSIASCASCQDAFASSPPLPTQRTESPASLPQATGHQFVSPNPTDGNRLDAQASSAAGIRARLMRSFPALLELFEFGAVKFNRIRVKGFAIQQNPLRNVAELVALRPKEFNLLVIIAACSINYFS